MWFAYWLSLPFTPKAQHGNRSHIALEKGKQRVKQYPEDFNADNGISFLIAK